MASLIRRLLHLNSVAINAGRRAACRRVTVAGRSYFFKTFAPTDAGMESFARELMAFQLFKGRFWMPPLILKGRRWFVRPYYSDQMRLDRVAQVLDADSRFEIAKQAVQILFEFFLAQYAHCDLHAENLFWVEGRLMVTDFEAMQPYARGKRPPFPLSYDLTGQGLESPFKTNNMCYVKQHHRQVALQQVLQVPLECLLEYLQSELKDELAAASQTFQSSGRRHTCRSGRIYGSFDLPYLSISPQESQRDSARRFENFGICAKDVEGRTVLDLGSNVGAMLFEVQKYRPARCVGVECDGDKVAIARKVAAYNGLNDVSFIHADVDRLVGEEVHGRYDIVLCLAIEAHVRNRERLYDLLAKTAARVVFFEGNSSTQPEVVQSNFLDRGFRKVQFLGFSDDDCLPENNFRPLLIAEK